MVEGPRALIRGVIPVAPTIFHDDERLDLDGQRRVLDFLIDAGSDAVCVLANYSEQFSLTDAERASVVESTIHHAGDRVPICVTTSHFSTDVAGRRSREAQALGASMVMLMPPFYGATMTVPEDAVLEYFKRVADGLDIDIMVQDAPLSPTLLSVELLTRLAREVPQVRYVKVETPQAAQKLRGLVAAAAENLPGVYDGEEGVTLIPDLDAGAQGTMCSSMLPDQLGLVVRDFHSGQREEAVARWEHWLPLIHFENRQCGLRAAKVLLQEGGIVGSARTRGPLPELEPATRLGLVDMARRRDALILRWATD